MEGEVGTQIGPPIFIQQSLPSLYHGAPPVPKKRDLTWHKHNFNLNSTPNWNPSRFDWDSVNFSVKPFSNPNSLAKGYEEGGGGENLVLELGRGGTPAVTEDVAVGRPSKKVRAGSPGNGGGNYPMCQVDDCKVNLLSAKDYHRRHKVCEVHSKMTKVILGKQMQRFCQQCSRFHPLSEFDEEKRSCRRRLAGHNRRRRKTQPEDTSSQSSPQNQGSGGDNNLDIVKFLALLAGFQGNGAEKVACSPLIPDKDQVNQILTKIQSLRASTTASKLPVSGGFDLNVSQVSEQPSSEQSPKINGNPSTMDLLAVLSAALSQASSDSTGNQLTRIFSSGASVKDGCTFQTQSQGPQPKLPLQLFCSMESDSPPQTTRKYVSSESSFPLDDRSPSSSPPLVQKFFPVNSASENRVHERMSLRREDNASNMTRARHGWIAPLDLSKKSERRVGTGTMHSVPCQAGYTSSSGSDHSPSSSNSDGQDRTGRISFKLFDKDPNNLPGALRSQILNWLSNSPSEMESYIRPGCVVLSVYASKPSGAWDALERNLLQRVSSLVECSESEFWRNGRFLVQTNTQLASYKDGKIRLCKFCKTWNAPELASVSPIAIVSGQQTSFVLKGRNLTAHGTRIHCSYMGGCTSKDVFSSACPSSTCNGTNMETFSFHGGLASCFGRCFIEVENGFRGNSFPVIIADATICEELRALESNFGGDRTTVAIVLHFLNELGWLFQRKNIHSHPYLTTFSIKRFNSLLTFSIERDWPALVKTLLDMLVERSIEGDESLMQESLEMLLEVQLLSRAVKRKCRKMIGLLLNYSVKRSIVNSKMYLFPPNLAGPGGVTPLHLAASTQDSEDMVDALTDDPQEIGLNCWNSILDESGQSPYMYASMRNNQSYNELVARKLADKHNRQISISVGNPKVSSTFQIVAAKSCASCAFMDTHRSKPILRTRGLLYRPYIHSMLAIAAVCVCVCLLMRGMPRVCSIQPFMWERLEYGPR